MEAIVERCCGLDVHQATVVACLMAGRADQRPKKTLRTFATTMPDLLELGQWLAAEGCTHVAMESTGVYWKPVYAMLEDTFEVVVGNARHIRNVPGRKTDVKDAEWIADLLRHGLIAKSFVPPPDIRELRDLVRYRRRLVDDRVKVRNRVLKLLETANIKLSTVLSDVFGVSGMAMLRGIARGEADETSLAALARGALRKKIPAIERAVTGRVAAHHRLLLTVQLEQLDLVEKQLVLLDTEIEARLTPYRAVCERVGALPGFGAVNTARVLAEVGTDMAAFRSEHHLASWAAICPGNHESAGKQSHGTARRGNIYLKTALVEAAQVAVKKKGSYVRAKFRRLTARRGYKRAIVAIAHKLLIALYHVVKGANFHDLGEEYLDKLDEQRTANSLVRRLKKLGYHVEVSRAQAVTA
jgi:transposase